MISQEEIARINELARKAKSPEGLTPQETAERHALRMAYLASVRETHAAQPACPGAGADQRGG